MFIYLLAANAFTGDINVKSLLPEKKKLMFVNLLKRYIN